MIWVLSTSFRLAFWPAPARPSAASAASACLDLVKTLYHGRQEPFSSAVLTNGEWYDLPKGLVYSLPLKAKGNCEYEVIDSVELSGFAKEKVQVSCQELEQERQIVSDLI